MFSIPVTQISEAVATQIAPHLVREVLSSDVGSRIHTWCRIHQPAVCDHIGFVLKPIKVDGAVCVPEKNFRTQHYQIIRIQDVFLPVGVS